MFAGRKEIIETLEAPAIPIYNWCESCKLRFLATLGMIEDEDLLTASSEKGLTCASEWING